MNFFNQKSGLVNLWANVIIEGSYKYEQVPNLLNLRVEVKKMLVTLGFMEE